MQIVANEGFKVRPLTLRVTERFRERHDSSLSGPAVTDESETAMHCIAVSSVNNRVLF